MFIIENMMRSMSRPNFFSVFSVSALGFLIIFVPLILAKGGRTICRILRFAGLKGERAFDKYHKLLNRADWNMLKGSKVLLQNILSGFSNKDTVYIAIDEHLERRRGSKINAIGCYRDGV